MIVKEEPVSAFAVYSEQFKQKKKPKKASNDSKQVRNKKKLKSKVSKSRQIEINEIGFILKTLNGQSSITDKDMLNFVAETELRRINKNSGKQKLKQLGSNIKIKNLDFIQKNVKSEKNTKSVDAGLKKNTLKMKVRNRHGQNSAAKNNNPTLTPYYENSKAENSYVTHENDPMVTDASPSKEPSVTHLENIEQVQEITKKENKSKVSKDQFNKKTLPQDQRKSKKDKLRARQSKKPNNNKNQANINLTNHFIGNSKQFDSNRVMPAKRLFEWLISPITETDFRNNYWEKKPLFIHHDDNRDSFSELLSTPQIDSMLRENAVYFTKHIDITSYTNGLRETHNLSGRAQASVVWDFYSNGCSVRLLNPQAFIPKIHSLNATLQEYFGCFVGANVYLTPPNSQGFAPHYDDIEAFVLQVEGKKHWKVYYPRNLKETLPRVSSPNFSQESIGKPILDVILEPGDMLYFPRGFIHQANTIEGEHSLHITLSAYQKTAWVDLLEKALPISLKRAAEEDLEFRRGLPLGYLALEYGNSDKEKAAFMQTAMGFVSKLGHYLSLSLGAAVDQMGAQFMHDALPPVFSQEAKSNCSLGSGLAMTKNGKLINRVEIGLDTRVRLVRANVCRLVEGEGESGDEIRLYHCLDNPLEYHAEEPQFLVLPPGGVPVITHLGKSFPHFVPVRSMSHQDPEELLTLVSDLWDAGLLATQGLKTVNK